MLKSGGSPPPVESLEEVQGSMSLCLLRRRLKIKMTQSTLFDESETKEEEQEEDIKIGIRIAEAEMDHNIREAFNAASPAKKKKAKQLLQEITTISLSGDEDDKAIVTFAKVLQLEKVLGIT